MNNLNESITKKLKVVTSVKHFKYDLKVFMSAENGDLSTMDMHCISIILEYKHHHEVDSCRHKINSNKIK